MGGTCKDACSLQDSEVLGVEGIKFVCRLLNWSCHVSLLSLCYTIRILAFSKASRKLYATLCHRYSFFEDLSTTIVP